MNKLFGFFFFIFILSGKNTFSQFQTLNSASPISCTCYTITPDSLGIYGSVWATDKINLNNSFDFTFNIFLGCNDNGADGIAFVIATSNSSTGVGGGGLGYQGIFPSIGVMIDTWPGSNANDPVYDHISISRDGEIVHGNAGELVPPVQASSISSDIEDCQWHTLQIVWDAPSQTMNVFFDNVLRMTYTDNIVANIFWGDSMMYWGLTGGTGGASNLQQFCYTLSSSFLSNTNSICQGDSIQFTNNSSSSLNNIVSWQWDFGDGNFWAQPNATHVFSNPGNFYTKLSITDSVGCTNEDSILITVFPNPVPVIITNGPFCYTDPPETLLVVPSGGIWNGSGISGDVFFPSIAGPGNHSVSYFFTDGNGCSGVDTAVFAVTDSLSSWLSILPDTVICTGGSVTLTSSVIGGTSPYSFLWNNGWTGSGPQTEYPTIPGCYTVTITDANGCKDTTPSICISIYPPISVDSQSDQTICEGETITLGATANGGNGSPLVITWNDSLADDSMVVTPASYPNPSTYWVIASDGCSLNDTDWVSINFFITPSVAFTSDTNGCVPFTVNFSNLTPNIISCQWDFGDGNVSSFCNPTNIFQNIGSYNVSLYIISTDTCPGDTTINNYINVITLPPPAQISNDTSIYQESTIELSATGGINYLWNTGEINPEIMVSPTETTTYFVTVTDANGCTSYGEVTVSLDFKYVIFVPSMFSPNNDGNNDQLFVRGLGIADFAFEIFNRWGENVFKTNDKKIGWDGKYEGRDLNTGVFVYYLKANMDNGEVIEKKGNITLVR